MLSTVDSGEVVFIVRLHLLQFEDFDFGGRVVDAWDLGYIFVVCKASLATAFAIVVALLEVLALVGGFSFFGCHLAELARDLLLPHCVNQLKDFAR